MRNNYSQKFKDEVKRRANSMTLDEIVELANTKYLYNTTKKLIRSYLSSKRIRWKDFDDKKIKKNLNNLIPIGSERINNGWVFVKVDSNKWKYKHRYIYEKYHNVELTRNDFIIFLDNNKRNFDINNLKKVSKKEMYYLIGCQLLTDYKDINEVGIDVAKLI